MLEGDRGAVRLCDWSVAERRRPDGTWERAADALSQVEARPIALRRQIEGVVRLTRGEAHHLATLTEALNVQEIVEDILAMARGPQGNQSWPQTISARRVSCDSTRHQCGSKSAPSGQMKSLKISSRRVW